jgi:hypothetical protein
MLLVCEDFWKDVANSKNGELEESHRFKFS